MIRNGADKDKITVVPHGIPIPNLDATETKNKDGKIRFYYVGRICYIKGIHIMLKAFSLLKDSNTELHLIGGAESKEEVRYQKSLKRKYRKDNRIIWHGKVVSEALPQLTKDFDALIHPTICLEVFGLDIAEALSQSKFVIATHCGGAEMQIKENLNGWLISPNNANELSLALQRYIDTPREAKEEIITLSEHIKTLHRLYTTIPCC